MLYTLKNYEKSNGEMPFDIWLEDQDITVRTIIKAKLDRIKLGNFSTCEVIGDGVSEIKIDVGPGYRIYYSKIGLTILLILCAGNKRSQKKDIDKAKAYLEDYKARGNHGKK